MATFYTLYDDEGKIHGVVTQESDSEANEYASNINMRAIKGSYDKWLYNINVSNNEVIRKTDFDLKIVNLNIPADESEHVIFKNLPPDTLVLIDNLPIGKTDATENLELSFAPQDSGIHKIILMNQNHTLSSGTFNLTAYEN